MSPRAQSFCLLEVQVRFRVCAIFSIIFGLFAPSRGETCLWVSTFSTPSRSGEPSQFKNSYPVLIVKHKLRPLLPFPGIFLKHESISLLQ